MEHSGEGKSTWGTKVSTSAGKFFGWRNRIYGRDNEHSTVYMTRFWIGRLRLHVFWRGDKDPDHHDHPWGFWTFPLHSYVEEVASYSSYKALRDMEEARKAGEDINAASEAGRRFGYTLHRQVVPAWRLTYRSAMHTHRVLGRYSGNVCDPFKAIVPCSAKRAATLPDAFEPYFDQRKIVTVVWRGKSGRKWGFLKLRDGRWCWTPWKEYVFGGGKDAPCE